MMTPTRKSGRQPKPSTKLKEYLYDNEIDKAKDSAPQSSEKKKPQVTKEPVPRVTEKKKAAAVAKEPPRMPEKRKAPQVVKEQASRVVEKRKPGPVKKEPEVRAGEKRKISQVTKEPEVRAGEKRKISQVTKESPDSSTPSRKSRRTPKPSAKLEEFLYEDDKEKSVEPVPGKRTLKSAEKAKVAVKIKEEPQEDFGAPIKKQVKKVTVDKRLDVQPKVVLNKLPGNESSVKKGKFSSNITSPRARVANLTSLSKKKERNAASSSHLSVMKGKVVRVKNMKAERTVTNIASASRKKDTAIKSNAVPGKGPSRLLKRKRELEVNSSKANKKIKKTPDSAKSSGKDSRLANQNKEGKSKVEKKEIEKVLHVNKEVMTQLLNFGAEVAEAMACNNESIFSFSTKDNPLQTFKIDKQDDFSDEEVVKIIKWFEEEEEQRRAYRKRILEALRASHETNMSLYTQMLKMLQSVTAC